jgi:asparagine synthase (glutamine-hydrolysing)
MCGIVGAFKPQGAVCSTEILGAMRDRMRHRGPDGAGVWRAADGRCGMAHRRLSIIDLSEAAAQPMANESGTVVVTFNGEIYNHAELRAELAALGKYRWATDHSDTEVLLHAYEEWGLGCVHRFRGMFGFAIYDARDPDRPLFHMARDRVGVKPVYFSRTATGEWLCASEIRALLAHPDVPRAMDRAAFWHYLTFIVAPAPLTLFRGIFKLPAGHVLTVDHRGATSFEQYWDCRPNAAATLTERDIGEDEAAGELLRLLRLAVERRMVSDVPFGVLLSGGVDSSLVTALMSEVLPRPVTTFTVGYESYDEMNEFHHARRIAERYRTNHHETRIDSKDAQEFLPLLVQLQDEPIADNVCIPLYFLAQLVRNSGTTVVQVGEGADENFLGYWWCDHFRNKEESIYGPAWQGRFPGKDAPAEDRAIAARARAGQELFWGGAVCWWGDMRLQLTPDAGPFAARIDCPVEGLLPESYQGPDSHAVVADYLAGLTGKLVAPESMQKIPYMEMKLRLPEHLLMRVDKMTMAHSVEARVPFLDHEVVEFATRLPPHYKLRDGIGKKVLKRASEPYVDHDLLYRRKQGFGAPMDQWFKEPDFGRRMLAAYERSRLRREGYFDDGYFRGLMKHQMGQGGGYGFHLWTVLNAVLWHEVWIEGNVDCL